LADATILFFFPLEPPLLVPPHPDGMEKQIQNKIILVKSKQHVVDLSPMSLSLLEI